MAFEFKLPDIGEGVVEGEIVQWLVKPGDTIDVDQPMVEVMTDKATVVIPSPVKGVVRQTRGSEGDLVEVHSVICVIDQEGDAPASSPQATTAAATPPPGAPAATAAPTSAGAGGGGKVLAAPATRRLARELGVDISTVVGTGPAGRVLGGDVRAAAVAPAEVVSAVPEPAVMPEEAVEAMVTGVSAHDIGGTAQSLRAEPVPAGPVTTSRALVAPSTISLPGEADERIPVRGLRRRIWDKMAQSAFTAAHFTFVEECDCGSLVETRKRFNARLGAEENKLTYLPFIVKAVVASLKRYPTLNGHVDDNGLAFVQRGHYHIGIAVASDRGLVVPVIRHADRRSILDLSIEILRLADAVRDNSIGPEDLGGSTFTITSLGKDGGIFATPIINYPEVAILGVHKMKKQPVVTDDDQIVIRPMMNFSLSFDHRWIDGHVGAEFTYSVIQLLEDPDRLMMEMV